MTVKTTIDVHGGTSVRDFLQTIGSGEILDFVFGPATGNPSVTLSFPTRDLAREFLVGWYPGHERSFIESNIDTLCEAA